MGPPRLSAATMASYAQAYATTVRRMVAAGRELYPEAVMWEHLATLGTEKKLLRPLRDFRASLARSSPRLHMIDPYTKLKQDMASVRPSELPLLPAYACQQVGNGPHHGARHDPLVAARHEAVAARHHEAGGGGGGRAHKAEARRSRRRKLRGK